MATMTERKTLAQFIAEHHITASAERADENPNMADMPRGSSHWKVTLRLGRRRIVVPFSQGPAICQEPTAADVLNCLASDAAGFENARSFEDWCSEYGYDTDSRKAEKTYKAVEKQSDQLKRLLADDDVFHSLLFDTEGL